MTIRLKNSRQWLLILTSTILSVLLLFSSINNPNVLSAQTLPISEDFNDNDANDGTPFDWDEEVSSGGFWTVDSGQYVGFTPSSGANIRSSAGESTWSDYIYEVSIKGLQGVDRHVLFRFDKEREHPKGYYFKILTGPPGVGYVELGKGNLGPLPLDNPKFVPFESYNNNWYQFRIQVIGNHIEIYNISDPDNIVELFDFIDKENPLLTGKVGVFVQQSSSFNTRTAYDNIVISSIGSETLPVPPLQQNDPEWAGEEYDDASEWTGVPTIARWGCALTSAAMILQYHGYEITPAELNTWLNSQSDGFLENGLVNWIAVTRYSKLFPNPDGKALEFLRLPVNNLADELAAGRPAILNLPGHFIVANGDLGDDFNIIDPDSALTLLSEIIAARGIDVSTIYSFTPTESDLSYLMLLINENFNIKVLDEADNEIEGFLLESPLTEDGGGTGVSGKPLGMFLFPKPPAANYNIEVTGNGIYQLESFLYDKSGNLINQQTSQDVVSEDGSDHFSTNVPGGDIEKQVSLESLLADLDAFYKNNQITHQLVYRSLKRLILSAQRIFNRGYTNYGRRLLIIAYRYIRIYTPWFINSEASTILQENLQILQNSL